MALLSLEKRRPACLLKDLVNDQRTTVKLMLLLSNSQAYIHIILAFANQYDYKIMSFDIKTAFFHARLPYSIYVKQIPGYPKENPCTVLKLLVALYGLKQSAYEWYKLLSTIFASLGLLHCKANHAVFIRQWTTSSPHLSIDMPSSRLPLTLIISIYVNDSLAVFDSLSLYHWFMMEMSKQINFVCLGPVINSHYLGHHIV
jgi:Reverse transcriptase (RNA-dependent DNA polymerase)